MRTKKNILWGCALVLGAALLLALPFLTGVLSESMLLRKGFLLESSPTGLSDEGAQYPFAVQMYEQALAGDADGEFFHMTAEGRLTQEEQLLPYLEEYLSQNGVREAPDWRQVWPVTREGHLVQAWYSPALRLYVSVMVTVPSDETAQTEVYGSVASIAQSDLAAYGISDAPQAVIPLDPSANLSMDAAGSADPLQMTSTAWRLCRLADQVALWEDCAWSMRSDADGRGWLYRVEYDTGVFTPACTLAECTHDIPLCEACFDVLRPDITDLGSQLLVSWYDGTTSEGYMNTCVCLVDPVSGQRSPQVTLGKGDLYNAFAANGKELLYATCDGRLRWMDLDGGWEKTLLKNETVIKAAFGDSADPSYTYWKIVDADAQSLTLHTSRWLQEDVMTADGRRAGDAMEHCLLRYDIAAETLSELYRWQDCNVLQAWAVNDGLLWKIDAQNGEIVCVTLAENKTQRWPVTGLETAVYVALDPFVGGRPVLAVLYPEKENTVRFVFDGDTHTLRRLSMTAFMKGSDRPVSYSDSGAGRVCIAHEVVQVTITETVYGAPESWVSDEIHYGFITAEDFLADHKNVVPFVLPE